MKRHEGKLKSPLAGDEDWDDFSSDLMIDVIDTAGQISWVNATEAEVLGLPPAAIAGLTVEACYSPASAEALRGLLERHLPEGFVTTLELELIGRGGRGIRTIARCRKINPAGTPQFRLIKLNLGHVGHAYDDMLAENQLLNRIITDASEAHWCIEFLEPVDINRSREEVVDQIFENRSIWRIANPAMQALYHLPGSGEFRAFDVRLYWPRTPENEAFVRQIIDSDYRIDASISSDRRYDGSMVNLENDVRAEIRETHLYRIWGNCRNMSGQRQATTPPLSEAFAAFPDPVLLLDANGAELGRNAACATVFSTAQPSPAMLKRILAHAAGGKPRRIWSMPVAGGGRHHFLATVHRRPDSRHGKVTMLLLQAEPVVK